jgi:hypothetical protein
MRKRIAVLIVLVLLVCGAGLSSPVPAGCADCARGGQVDNSCQDESDSVYTDCLQLYGGGPLGPFGTYCFNRASDAYNGCVTLHGCPNLAN